MLNKDLTVIFKHSHGIYLKAIEVNQVTFDLELIGENHVVEDIDYTLIEDFDDSRLVINITAQLDLPTANWIRDFIVAKNSKILVIDGYEIPVVNSKNNYKFPLFKKYNLFTLSSLQFKARDKGLSMFDAQSIQQIGYLSYSVGV